MSATSPAVLRFDHAYLVSIEVMDGASSASLWSEAHGDAIVEAAFLSGASDWQWHRLTWGVVLELAFETEDCWDRFVSQPAVGAALEAVPDPVSGLIMYKGRGGSAGNGVPKRPRPLIGSGASELPIPWILEDDWTELRMAPLNVSERRPLLGALNQLR